MLRLERQPDASGTAVELELRVEPVLARAIDVQKCDQDMIGTISENSLTSISTYWSDMILRDRSQSQKLIGRSQNESWKVVDRQKYLDGGGGHLVSDLDDTALPMYKFLQFRKHNDYANYQLHFHTKHARNRSIYFLGVSHCALSASILLLWPHSTILHKPQAANEKDQTVAVRVLLTCPLSGDKGGSTHTTECLSREVCHPIVSLVLTRLEASTKRYIQFPY